jgi:hypothetical protein
MQLLLLKYESADSFAFFSPYHAARTHTLSYESLRLNVNENNNFFPNVGSKKKEFFFFENYPQVYACLLCACASPRMLLLLSLLIEKFMKTVMILV